MRGFMGALDWMGECLLRTVHDLCMYVREVVVNLYWRMRARAASD